jgi:hypothetical protein
MLYTMTIHRNSAKTGTHLRTNQISFNAGNVDGAIQWARNWVSRRNAPDYSTASVLQYNLTNLRVAVKRQRGNPRYDPQMPCDDCYRPWWKGHNDKVEH